MRNLERRLADVCRKAAAQVAKGKTQKTRVDDRKLREWLGPRRFSGEVRKRTSAPGVATGLAYTAAGGDVLFIEATAYPGKGNLHGDRPARRRDAGVGAGGALVGALARGRRSASPEDWFEKHDVHIHVPAGAVPKDGPSAGVTMATAIASLMRGEPVADDVGMTGEITLTGQVLPIGGHPREVARRAARGPEARDLPARERDRPRRPAARDARGARRSSRPTRSRTSSPPRSTAAAARARSAGRQASSARRHARSGRSSLGTPAESAKLVERAAGTASSSPVGRRGDRGAGAPAGPRGRT